MTLFWHVNHALSGIIHVVRDFVEYVLFAILHEIFFISTLSFLRKQILMVDEEPVIVNLQAVLLLSKRTFFLHIFNIHIYTQ